MIDVRCDSYVNKSKIISRDLLKFRCLNFSFSFRRWLLHIFYIKIVVLVRYNFCRHNLQFLVP
jgi:hypothetical protein